MGETCCLLIEPVSTLAVKKLYDYSGPVSTEYIPVGPEFGDKVQVKGGLCLNVSNVTIKRQILVKSDTEIPLSSPGNQL